MVELIFATWAGVVLRCAPTIWMERMHASKSIVELVTILFGL